MPTEKMIFSGHAGDRLAARLDLPEGPHLATALFAHCFTCGKDILAARRIARRLAAMGIAVLRFDVTGLGHSGGEFENATFTSNVEDLVAAAGALADRDMPPALLIGHSLGGAAAIRAARSIPSAKAVAVLGAPYDPGHVARNFAGALERIDAEGWAEVTLAGRKFRIGRDFIEDVCGDAITADLGHLKRALLVMHAPEDEVVGIENATRIFIAAKHPKSFVTLDKADHLISDGADAEYAAGVIAAWASRYLDLRPPAPPPGAPEGVTRVSEADPRGFLQDISAGAVHHALADEPKAYGGTNRGMSPYQFLAAGLGACTSMTIRMYARRKGWPLAHVRVDVTHDKVHAQDCIHCTEDDKLDRFTRVITLDGPLDAEQRGRLIEIADRCPVHRTLSRGAKIETRLTGATPALTAD
ncbi:bifunctional alpha/beta hydrolase/OsmC family protein [Acidimangrovimonas sediminis]|uniref:bifunctional alpha/beta hydrolase/OsmC family protein n=1 Tax=Acidimangrovimonas sediminis TaxID=2056283 RepID=UPI000C80BB14|nr:bifunctional alpha/beta hydrolase/OsmC family protein [Acidimangrovimonas sediminis]